MPVDFLRTSTVVSYKAIVNHSTRNAFPGWQWLYGNPPPQPTHPPPPTHTPTTHTHTHTSDLPPHVYIGKLYLGKDQSFFMTKILGEENQS